MALTIRKWKEKCKAVTVELEKRDEIINSLQKQIANSDQGRKSHETGTKL